jgi:mRNA interferase MazF
MRKHSVTYRQWDVVVVPFPFSNRSEAKRRPALVLSDRTFNIQGHTILAMVTTSGHYPWTGDVNLADYKAAGLSTPCLVRLKLFTLDNRLISKRIGLLSANDRKQVIRQLQTYLPW